MRAGRKITVAGVIEDLTKLIRVEPTCIKCGCTEDRACPEGCSWTFLNRKTNEGLCSACFEQLNRKALGAMGVNLE